MPTYSQDINILCPISVIYRTNVVNSYFSRVIPKFAIIFPQVHLIQLCTGHLQDTGLVVTKNFKGPVMMSSLSASLFINTKLKVWIKVELISKQGLIKWVLLPPGMNDHQVALIE